MMGNIWFVIVIIIAICGWGVAVILLYKNSKLTKDYQNLWSKFMNLKNKADENEKLSEECRNWKQKTAEVEIQLNSLKKEQDVLEIKYQEEIKKLQQQIQMESPLEKSEALQIGSIKKAERIKQEKLKEIDKEKEISTLLCVPFTDALVFSNQNYNRVVESLLDCGEISSFLENAEYSNAKVYQKLIQSYKDEIEENFESINGDPEEIPTLCAAKFAYCFKNYFVDGIIDSVYKGMKSGEKFYFDFIKIINIYLQNNNIYTKKVMRGIRYEKLVYMEAQKKKTTNESEHKQIDEILLQPYYINYVDENGKKQEKLLSKGSCVVLSIK